MSNLESHYLQLCRELVLKYGKKPLLTPGKKALALILLTRSFKKVPAEVTFQEELNILLKPFENMYMPEVATQLNDLQSDFLKNRFIEIINENSNSSSIHDPRNITTQSKIAAVESLGIKISDSMNKPLPTGQTVGELIEDLYQLYLIEYRAFCKNREHPIFCLVEMEDAEPAIQESPQPAASSSKNNGCRGLVASSIVLATGMLALACS
jgi:hypothetical protein